MIQTMCSADFMKGLNFPAEAIEELLRAEKHLDAAESLKPVFAAAEKADKPVVEGAVIVVRGKGKFIVRALSDKTKKGRFRLVADQYL